MSRIAEAYKFISDPNLLVSILRFFGAVAGIILVIAIGIWNVVGAWKVLTFLIRLTN